MTTNPDFEAPAQDQADTTAQKSVQPGASLPEYITPGKILREAREQQKLNRARVGQGLGLTETAVKNLESNRFDLFPGSVYVRGYLKNYARLLDLSEEELIDIYDKYCLDHDLDTGKSSMDSMPENVQAVTTQKILLAVFALGALVAIIFLLIASFA